MPSLPKKKATARSVYEHFFTEEKIIIEISDDGVGMDEETQIRMFEPFFTTKDVGRGTGLGMSISFGIIKSHKGTIELNSKPGEGTVVRLALPLQHNPESENE
jgi:signal transduction histidine kinase